MDVLLRLLLRVILVPLGILAAGAAATLVVAIGNWRMIVDSAGANVSPDEVMTFAVIVFPFIIALYVVVAALVVPLACIGVLISEAFAIRSWIFHALNGALSTWVGWFLLEQFREQTKIPLEQALMIGAGIAGGFAYWLVAGSSAGFWKPVFGRTEQVLLTPPDPPPALPPSRPA
jgi:hypothetical protein